MKRSLFYQYFTYLFIGLTASLLVACSSEKTPSSKQSIVNQAPIALISIGDNEINETYDASLGDKLTLSAAGSSDLDGSIEHYLWSTGETSQVITIIASTLGISHYSLSITDNAGTVSSKQFSINTTSSDIGPETQAPVALVSVNGIVVDNNIIAANIDASVGDTLTLSAVQSSVVEGSIKHYLWSTGETSPEITMELSTAQMTIISLTVTDDNNASTRTQVTINVQANNEPVNVNLLPYQFINHSSYANENIYIGLVGKIDGNNIWMDAETSTIMPMDASYNTLPGPNYYNLPEARKYPDMFTKLSDIKNSTIYIPKISGARIFISFEHPLYIYFHPKHANGEQGGFAGVDFANESDPNTGIRWELIELTWADNGLWTNTSRVDTYQYPMQLEVFDATGSVAKVGEKLSHETILNKWQAMFPKGSPFNACYVTKDPNKYVFADGQAIIEQPSKIPEFKAGGASEDFFASYINAIWENYSSKTLLIDIGNRGLWSGKIQGDEFIFTGPNNAEQAKIARKPTTQEVIEAKGALAEGNSNDLMIQAQISAAINRHAIYLDDEQVQFLHDERRYFKRTPYNDYVKFWHSEEISIDSKTYAFAYDDVGDHSSTIQSSQPSHVTVTIGGNGVGDTVKTGASTHFERFGEPYGGCGVPQTLLETQNFVALNVYNSPGIYDFFPRPIIGEDLQYIGEFENGKNCGRWLEVTISDICDGQNSGSAGMGFCENGTWFEDEYTGAHLSMLVGDSCGDANAWCRDSRYHLDLASDSLNKFIKDGKAVNDMYPLHWNNRNIKWNYVKAPNYSGDIKIHFIKGAEQWWAAILITHLENGIHSVEQLVDGQWLSATMNGDMGQSYLLPDPLASPFQIRVLDASDNYINQGRQYRFDFPAACGTKCIEATTLTEYETLD